MKYDFFINNIVYIVIAFAEDSSWKKAKAKPLRGYINEDFPAPESRIKGHIFQAGLARRQHALSPPRKLLRKEKSLEKWNHW